MDCWENSALDGARADLAGVSAVERGDISWGDVCGDDGDDHGTFWPFSSYL